MDEPIEELIQIAGFVDPDRWMCSPEDKEKYKRWYLLMNTLIVVMEANPSFENAFCLALEAAND